MKSFGRLLRRMRGATPLLEVAEKSGLKVQELEQIEAGSLVIDEAEARRLLAQSFEVEGDAADRLILGVQLYDLGLEDNDLRQLVIDLIRKTAPQPVLEKLRRLYHSYKAKAE